MEKLKIYLGDLTYDTIVISTEAFPLNIGFITSYCKEIFGDKVDITLFKYIDHLEKALRESPPDILGLSNYCWNQRIGVEMFNIVTELNPNTIKVWGGPNFPIDLESQKVFFNEFPQIDVYVPVEGEIGFSNVVRKCLDAKSPELMRYEVKKIPFDGCITKNSEGNLQYSEYIQRTNSLDGIPSPYTTGILDPFFDGKLTPMLQTNRGCPFSCSFCVDGSDTVRKVNQFSMERVISDIDYIAKHVPKNVHTLHITDLNFGMMPRDLEVCDHISNAQKQYNYPQNIIATTGKNSKERIIKAIKKLDGALGFSMSVQSMDQDVLKNVKRDNISVEHMLALEPAIKEANLETVTEVILGLPGDSYQSHIQTLRDLVRAKIQNIQVYTCMILQGSELGTPTEKKKWGLQTKFRLLPRDFVQLSNGKKVIEIEEVVIASNSMTFEEYVELRLLAFSMGVTTFGDVYYPIIKLLREYDCDIFELIHRIVTTLDNAPSGVQEAFQRFKDATLGELWSSPQAIIEHYQDDKEYEKLLNAEAGMNVMQFHNALVISEYMEDWKENLLSISRQLLSKKNIAHFEDQFNSVANYCRGISFNVLKRDRNNTNPKYSLYYDVESWISNDTKKLIDFKFYSSKEFIFSLSDEQFHIVEDELDVHGDNSTGYGQLLKRVPHKMLWRKPIDISLESKLVNAT